MIKNGYRQRCIAACPEDIRQLIQKAIDRAFEHGRYVEGPIEPYYSARDHALALIGRLILERRAELEALEKGNGSG